VVDKDTFKNIIDRLTLNDEDRESLKVKRGFTDEVIEKLQFKSISQKIVNNDEYLSKLPTEFKNAFITPNILIPYPEKDGSFIHLRPHKFGIAGLKIKPYIPFPVMKPPLNTMVLAESEFKAVASCMYGVPAIGIPGIASFSGDHFVLLCEILRVFNPDRLVICFDNEFKGDPTTSNYKPDFKKRYDTQYYAYIMAKKLNDLAHIPTLIATLDPNWMKNNKIDIDGALASGISAESYKRVIENAKPYYTYKREWDVAPAHKSFMERRVDKYFYDETIKEDFGVYKTGKGKSKDLSTFTIKLIHTIIDEEGHCERICKLISKYGHSHVVKLTADEMVGLPAFKKFCVAAGDYRFLGDQKDMENLWEYIFMQQDGRTIYKLPYFGYNDETDAWFFSHGAYKNNEFFPIDNDGVIWLEDVGYKIVNKINDLLSPVLSHDRTEGINPKAIFDRMAKILNVNEAKLILGWAIGNFFMPEILKTYKKYPFLFLFGKLASGKSTIANWISSFFGFTMQNGVNLHQSTIVGVSRTTAEMSMIPLWLEEYRNSDKAIGAKNNFLRSVYDKSTIVKGTKRENEIKTYLARSTLVISGEEHPHDAALNSRCVQFPIYRETNTETLADFRWLQDNKGFFNEIGDKLLRDKETYWIKIKDRIDSYINSFVEEKINVSDRQRTHMSIIGGICDVLLDQSSDFSIYLAERTMLQDEKITESQALYVFFDDLLNMQMAKRFKTPIVREVDDTLCLNFGYAYAEWEVFFRGLRNDIPASKIALLEHLKREPYYVTSKNVRIAKAVPHCVVMDMKSHKLPEVLRSILIQEQTENQVAGPIGEINESDIFNQAQRA